LREAKDAALGGEYPLAKQKLAEARQLLPRESAALIRLAKIHEIQAQDNEAERAYRQALALSPNDREALEGLAALYLRTGREQEIAALQTKLPPAQRKQLDQAVGTAKADKLRQQAEQLLARHQQQEAIALYEQAVRMDENDPWLRYDLARLYASQGQAKKGQALFNELLQRQPNNAEALYAMALFQSGQEQDMLALSTLERIAPNARSRNMSLLQRRLWLGVQKQRMLWLLEHGQRDEALALLHKIENTLGDDPDLTSEMADVYIAAGQDERAFALIGLQEEKRQDTAWQLRRARLLTKKPSKKNDAELAGLLERIAAQPLSAGQQRDLTDLRHLRAEWLRKQGRYGEAEEIYRAILAQHPADDDATLALIDTQIEAGETKAAQQQIGQAAASRDDPEYLAELLDRLIDTGDDEQAQKLAERILSIAPEHAPTLRLAGKLAQKNNRLEQAIAYRQRALHSAKTGGATTEKSGKDYRILAEMLDENSRWLSAAFDWHTRTGTPGTSQLDMKETTLEWKEAAHKYGHPYARADLVQIDAGLLDLASYAGHTFGTGCLTCSGVSLQNAIGLGLNAGIVSDSLRVDIGTTPLGFPVQNLNGGVLLKGGWKALSLSVDASRRAVTSSLLSYAGAKDPSTGRVWGGVQATGVRFGLALDNGGALGLWASLGQHVLTGENVQSNDRMQLMGGVYWRAINEENRLLTIGLTGMHWRYGKNAGEYTFGHGGYYSPESFTSLSIPVAYGERSARFSYRLRGAVASSKSNTAAAAYFPTDTALQATNNNFYSAGSGNGISLSLLAEGEYQMDRRWFLGARAEVDRSVDYAPNRFLVYLRYNLDHTAAKPVNFWPEPVFPTSQF
jgi:tetratricopeptide (TPR) repeat protein